MVSISNSINKGSAKMLKWFSINLWLSWKIEESRGYYRYGVLKELGFLFLLNENNGPDINEDTMELTFAI